MDRTMMRRVATTLIAMGMVLGGATLLIPTAGGASTTDTGAGITYTLEGCRASTNAYVAPSTYICPDANYTTGNLGKGWNEFDLVPGRVTLSAGTSAPATQTYSFVIAVDNCSTGDGATGCTSGRPGYDRLSSDSGGVPTINSSLSSSSGCGTISATDPKYATGSSAIGGTGTSLYRTITITGQATGTTCVYDFFARLAFNSHLYPGSSLHFDLANSALGTAGIGAKDVSIPVSAILPPGLDKTQTSSQGSSSVWSVSKTATPTSFDFLNTCSTAENEPTSKAVSVTVTWTKSTTTAGDITVVGHISLTNTAHRTINFAVSDQLFKDATWTTADGAPILTAKALAGGTSYSFDDTFTVPSGTASAFSDTATVTFTDPVFSDTLGTGTAKASSNVVTVASNSGATASIQDVEQMTGSTDFNFSVDSVTSGTFENSYTLGTHTRGPVTWDSGSLSASGSATFGKTIYVLHANNGIATLGDTATLTPNGQEATTGSASTVVNGNATVSIVISKTMDTKFDTDKTFTFNATGSDHSTGSTTIVIPAGQQGPVTGTISGLNPGISYSIDEPAVAPFPEQTTSAEVSLPSCSKTVEVVNTAPTTTSTSTSTTSTSTTSTSTTSTSTTSTTSTSVPSFCCVIETTTTLPATTTVPPTTVPPTTSTTVGARVLPEQGSTTVAPTTAAPTKLPTAVLPVTGQRSLPFTGRNVQWLVMAALALILLGLALLAEGRRTPSARNWE